MKRIFSLKHLAVLIVLLGSATFSFAQANGAGRTSELPFGVGESLTYEGKINKFAVSVTVGDMTLEVASVTDDGKLQLKADARSRGTMLKLFRYSFSQQIETLADANRLYAFTAKKHDVQKQKVRDSFSAFNYNRKVVTWVETNPNEPTQPPRTIASDLDGPTHDIVSAMYFLRTLPMSVGYSTSMYVSDSGLVYQIPVKVAARERQKTIFGDIWCYRVEPLVFGPGRFFEQKGKMEIWITEDARRIPVRARVNAEVGKIDVRLKETKNLK